MFWKKRNMFLILAFIWKKNPVELVREECETPSENWMTYEIRKNDILILMLINLYYSLSLHFTQILNEGFELFFNNFEKKTYVSSLFYNITKFYYFQKRYVDGVERKISSQTNKSLWLSHLRIEDGKFL